MTTEVEMIKRRTLEAGLEIAKLEFEAGAPTDEALVKVKEHYMKTVADPEGTSDAAGFGEV